MAPVIKRVWAWLKRHARPMPEESDLTKSKQVDDNRFFFGFRFWF